MIKETHVCGMKRYVLPNEKMKQMISHTIFEKVRKNEYVIHQLHIITKRFNRN